MQKIDPRLTKKHFRAVIYKAFLELCRKKYPHIDREKLCEDAGLPMEYLENESNWVSVVFANRFTKLLIERTGSKDVSYEGGHQAFSPEMLGRPLYLLATHGLSLNFIFRSLPHPCFILLIPF